VVLLRVEDRQRPQLDFLLELALAAEGVPRRVHHREAERRLAAADERDVVHRSAGDLRRHLHARHGLREHVSHGAAERVPDAAGAAGADRQGLRARRSERGREQDASGEISHGFLHVV
jgi:hypothetical protein